MSDSSFDIHRGSERNFGIVFAVVFAALGCYLNWRSTSITVWPFVLSAVFLSTALIIPKLLYYPNLFWHRLGLLLGAIVAPIVMAVVYITTVVPMGLGAKVLRKDLLNLKRDKEVKSYWIERKSPPQPMKNQF